MRLSDGGPVTPAGGGSGVRQRSLATTATITLVPMLSVAPVFLLGGLATLVRTELGFGEAMLGILTAVFFAASAVVAVPGGRVSDRIGPRRALQLGLIGSSVSLAGIALGVDSSGALAGWLVIGGASNGFVNPAANLGLVRGVEVRSQGLAFGAKQSAIPLATLLAGISVPVIGLTIGWRWAFGLAALTCFPLLLAIRHIIPAPPSVASPSTVPRPRGVIGPRLKGRGLVLVALAGACAGAAATSLGMFYVESVAAGRLSLATAGLLLSFGSVLCVGARLLVGWVADRSPIDPLVIVVWQLLAGALGFAFLTGPGGSLALLMLATGVAFAAGWGWAGLLQFAVVRRNLDAPAAATGMTQTGVYIGNVVGPIAFGAMVSAAGYAVAWQAAAATLTLGAALLWIARRRAPAMPVG